MLNIIVFLFLPLDMCRLLVDNILHDIITSYNTCTCMWCWCLNRTGVFWLLTLSDGYIIKVKAVIICPVHVGINRTWNYITYFYCMFAETFIFFFLNEQNIITIPKKNWKGVNIKTQYKGKIYSKIISQ